METPQERQAEREIVVTLRLPRELHARLQELGGPRGLTREIRERLEASFGGQPPATADEKTASMLQQFAQLAAIVSEHYGTWHENPRAYAIFKRAVELGLPDYNPAPFDEQGMVKSPPSEAEQQDIDSKAFMVAAMAGFAGVW